MVGRTAVLLLLMLTGCHGCARQSDPEPTNAPTTTTTTRAPIVEATISANSAPSTDRGNAWASGGGIDWPHIGPGGGGQSSNNRGTSASPGAMTGSTGSTGSASGSSGSTGSTGSASGTSGSTGSTGSASGSSGSTGSSVSASGSSGSTGSTGSASGSSGSTGSSGSASGSSGSTGSSGSASGSSGSTGSSGSASGSSGATGSSGSASGSSGSSGSSAQSGSSVPEPATRSDLRRLSQDLFDSDTNAVGSQVTIDPQGKAPLTPGEDNAPRHLITSVSPQVLRGATIAPFWALLDNYAPSVNVREQQTGQETQEEEAFLTAIMATTVMTKTEQFLRQKGFITAPLKDVLRELWFTPYTRSRRTLGSSGFEHVFVGELKAGQVSGFHNWLTYYKEEQEGDLNYLGHMRTLDLGPQAKLVLLKFTWSGDLKPVGSMFVGTSPELEMALFTVCYYARPGNNCPMEINGKKFNIKTYSQTYNGRSYIGSAFPNI